MLNPGVNHFCVTDLRGFRRGSGPGDLNGGINMGIGAGASGSEVGVGAGASWVGAPEASGAGGEVFLSSVFLGGGRGDSCVSAGCFNDS